MGEARTLLTRSLAEHLESLQALADSKLAEIEEAPGIVLYTLVEAESLAEVVAWARKWPPLDAHGEVELEIRQLYEIDDFGDAFSPELKADAQRIMGGS